jgi:hypothetical protein
MMPQPDFHRSTRGGFSLPAGKSSDKRCKQHKCIIRQYLATICVAAGSGIAAEFGAASGVAFVGI